MRFFDCHCHSSYSLLDGLNSPEELVVRGKEIGLDGLNLTDHGTLAGHRDMLRAGIKHDFPIALGVEAYFSGSNDRFNRMSKAKRQDGEDVYNHLILIAKNDNGLQNIQRIQAAGWTESFYQKCIIDMDLLEQFREDIIITSACVSGLVAKNIVNGELEKSINWALEFKRVFNDDFYIEIQDHNNDISEGLNEALLGVADQCGIKPIITTDTHFADPADRWIEDAMLIINTNPKKNPDIEMSKMEKMDFMEKYNYLYPERTMTFEHIDLYLQNGVTLFDKMKKRGIDREDIYANTIEIMEKIGG